MNFRLKRELRGCQYNSTTHYKRCPLGNNILDWEIGEKNVRGPEQCGLLKEKAPIQRDGTK